MINTFNNKNIYDLDIQKEWGMKEGTQQQPLWNGCPMQDSADFEQSVLSIKGYFESLHGSSGAPCSYIICKDIITLTYINEINSFHQDPGTLMVAQCPIIPIEQHIWYYDGLDAEILEELDDSCSPKYHLDLDMSYAEFTVIIQHTPAELCI